MSTIKGRKAILAADGVVMFHCPGCDAAHAVYINPQTNAAGVHWEFSGDYDAPTFSPSLLIHESDVQPRCHSFIESGMMRFLPDCTHALAGQAVKIPDWEGYTK